MASFRNLGGFFKYPSRFQLNGVGLNISAIEVMAVLYRNCWDITPPEDLCLGFTFRCATQTPIAETKSLTLAINSKKIRELLYKG